MRSLPGTGAARQWRTGRVDETGERKATAADFVRHFGNWRDTAREGPVFITHHGRSTHVLLDIAAYDDLVRGAPPPAPRRSIDSRGESGPLSEPLAAFIDWLSLGTILCDSDLRILAVNRTAWSMIGTPQADLLGQVLWDAVPAFAGSLGQSYIKRCLQSGEPVAADLPSPLRANNWMRLDVFPLADGIGIVMRDITEDVTRNRLANVKEAILRAMSLHGEIGYMRLSTVGTVERVDDPLCEMIGLPEERLIGVPAIDIVARHARAPFREALAQVISAGGDVRFDGALLSNSGQDVAVSVAMVGLRGAYGMEGCVAVFTRADPVAERAVAGMAQAL